MCLLSHVSNSVQEQAQGTQRCLCCGGIQLNLSIQMLFICQGTELHLVSHCTDQTLRKGYVPSLTTGGALLLSLLYRGTPG